MLSPIKDKNKKEKYLKEEEKDKNVKEAKKEKNVEDQKENKPFGHSRQQCDFHGAIKLIRSVTADKFINGYSFIFADALRNICRNFKQVNNYGYDYYACETVAVEGNIIQSSFYKGFRNENAAFAKTKQQDVICKPPFESELYGNVSIIRYEEQQQDRKRQA